MLSGKKPSDNGKFHKGDIVFHLLLKRRMKFDCYLKGGDCQLQSLDGKKEHYAHPTEIEPAFKTDDVKPPETNKPKPKTDRDALVGDVKEMCSNEGFAINPLPLQRMIGLELASFLAFLLNWQVTHGFDMKTGRHLNDGEFYCTTETIRERTLCTAQQQRTMFAKLETLKYVTTRLTRTPKRVRWITLNRQRILDDLGKLPSLRSGK